MKYAIDSFEDFITGKYNVISYTKFDKQALSIDKQFTEAFIDSDVNNLDSGKDGIMLDISTQKAGFFFKLSSKYKQVVIDEVKSKASLIKNEEELRVFINQQHQFAISYVNSLNKRIKSNALLKDYSKDLPRITNELINYSIIKDLIRIVLFIQEKWGRYIPIEQHFSLTNWSKANSVGMGEDLVDFENYREAIREKNEVDNNILNRESLLMTNRITKTKTKLSVPQLGFVFAELQQRGILQFPSKTAAIDFAVQHFSSEKKEDVSSKQARKKSYALSAKEKNEVVELFKSLYIDSLNGNKKVAKK